MPAAEGLMDGCGQVSTAQMADMKGVLALMGMGELEGSLVHRSRKEIAEDISRGNCFVYRKGGETTGLVFLSAYSRRLAEIRSLYVMECSRTNGAGAGLIRAAAARAHSLGIKEVLAITKKHNECWFQQQGFSQKLEFRVPLFLKPEGRTGASRDGHILTARKRHLSLVLSLMEKGEAEGWLVHRDEMEIAEDVRRGNCFLYSKGGETEGTVFLSAYSKRLAEVRGLYVSRAYRENGAGIALLDAAICRAQELGINEVLTINKTEHEPWFREAGFTSELQGFRVALFLRPEPR